jgi:hypothetical protein
VLGRPCQLVYSDDQIAGSWAMWLKAQQIVSSGHSRLLHRYLAKSLRVINEAREFKVYIEI